MSGRSHLFFTFIAGSLAWRRGLWMWISVLFAFVRSWRRVNFLIGVLLLTWSNDMRVFLPVRGHLESWFWLQWWKGNFRGILMFFKNEDFKSAWSIQNSEWYNIPGVDQSDNSDSQRSRAENRNQRFCTKVQARFQFLWWSIVKSVCLNLSTDKHYRLCCIQSGLESDSGLKSFRSQNTCNGKCINFMLVVSVTWSYRHHETNFPQVKFWHRKLQESCCARRILADRQPPLPSLLWWR